MTQELFPGYTIERLPEANGTLSAAYKITGPKRVWYLHRNQVNPHMLFPIPETGIRGQLSIRGVKWFSDRTGELRPCR